MSEYTRFLNIQSMHFYYKHLLQTYHVFMVDSVISYHFEYKISTLTLRV